MILLLPIIIFVVSSATVMWLIWRKTPYLKKLTPEILEAAPGAGDSFLGEMYPEIRGFLARLDLPAKKLAFMNESEKILRRLRLLFLRFESWIVMLINSIREQSRRHEERIAEEAVTMQLMPATLPVMNAKLQIKQREQELIIEIAKDPRKAVLYIELGDLYSTLGEIGDARQSYATALEINQEDVETKRKLDRLPSAIPVEK